MELDQKQSKTKVNHRYQYVVQRSKIGMKRSSWRWMESFESLDECFQYLRRIQLYRDLDKDYFKTYKYRIGHRKSTYELTTVSPKDIMVMRIKHGV